MKTTIGSSITHRGVGLHSGVMITMTLRPAQAHEGIVFIRTDLSADQNRIPALWNRVPDTRLCTVLANEYGASVGTVEHLMSALCGCGIDAVVVEVDGPELPAMDGSARDFVALIESAGVQKLGAPRRVIRILEEIAVRDGDKSASLSPSAFASYTARIDFDHVCIGTQEKTVQLLNGNYKHEIAAARTFGFLQEVEWMRAQGLGRGGSLDNAVVLDETGVMNPGGLRFADEFIRHKILDAIGDLYLAGMPIVGAYTAHKPGHALNNQLLRALFDAPHAWCVEEEGRGALSLGPNRTASPSRPDADSVPA